MTSGPVNVSNPAFTDASGNNVTVSATNPLPVTPVSSGVDQDVNIAAVGGTATVTGGVNGLLAVGGNAASAATDTGNPVKVGAKYNTTPATLTDGQRSDLTVDARQNLKVALYSGLQAITAGSPSDTMANTSILSWVTAFGALFDGTDWGRHRTPDSTIGSAYVENGPYTMGVATTDTQIKATAGFVHSITISPTGAVTAGVVTVYNSATETGTGIPFALPVTTFTPFSVIVDAAFGNGIYVGFDATLAGVQVTVSYR